MLNNLTRSIFVWATMTLACFFSGISFGASSTGTRNFIVAIVDSVPITNHDVALHAPLLRDQLQQQGRSVPSGDALLKAALEKLIVEKALLQHAKETGITVDDEAVNQAEQRLAAQSQLSTAALHEKMRAQGTSVDRLRQNLREQLTLQRLSERNVPSRIKISDSEIDQAMRERQNASINTNPDIELGHVLISIPEKANDTEVAALKAKAELALANLRRGDDLARVAKEFSNGAERDKGGLMGLRSASRYPVLFVDATRKLNIGDVTLVRSDAGFHVLKLVTKRASEVLTVTQTHPRHILLRPSGKLSQSTARAQLADYKRQIEAGKADFAKLAGNTHKTPADPMAATWAGSRPECLFLNLKRL